MNYSTFDRFQGAWLGSMIGLAVGSNTNQSEPISRIWHRQAYPWLATRENIAQTIVRTQSLGSSEIVEQLITLIEPSFAKLNANGNKLETSVTSDGINSSLILAWLPLIIFQPEQQLIYTKFLAEYNLRLGDSAEIAADILLWNYLLTLILNNQLQLGAMKIGNPIERILAGVEVTDNCLNKQLKIVSEAWCRGLSLQQLTEELAWQSSPETNVMATSKLIALSLYCFASTPNDFMLSVQRASHLHPHLAPAIAALTATLSGAYNGIARLPSNWRATAHRHRVYQQAQATIAALYKTWLGVDRPLQADCNFTYDSTIDAVALPKIIQTRPTLKIISQKFDLN